MQELDDIALLREDVDHASEEAFATLVTRHINNVYSVALRHTRNAQQAEEITQPVLVILAKKSRCLETRRGSDLCIQNLQCAALSDPKIVPSERVVATEKFDQA